MQRVGRQFIADEVTGIVQVVDGIDGYKIIAARNEGYVAGVIGEGTLNARSADEKTKHVVVVAANEFTILFRGKYIAESNERIERYKIKFQPHAIPHGGIGKEVEVGVSTDVVEIAAFVCEIIGADSMSNGAGGKYDALFQSNRTRSVFKITDAGSGAYGRDVADVVADAAGKNVAYQLIGGVLA